MGKNRGKGKVTAMASRRSRNGKRQRKEEENYFEHLPEEIIEEILSRMPLLSVIEAQSVCHSWRTTISSSPQFHKMWDEKNGEQWLVMDHSDRGVKIFNPNGCGELKKKMFDSPSWVLKGASGGLLLYQHKTEGLLRIVNPLTMEARELPDPVLREEHLSFYLKTERVPIDVIVDSTTKTYQVVIVSCLNQAAKVVIYRSSTSSWEIKVVSRIVKSYWAPYKTGGNQTVYCLPLHAPAPPSYNLRGEIVHTSRGRVLKGFALGRDVKVVLWSSPIGRSFMFIFEMDAEAAAAAPQWRVVSVCRWNGRRSLNRRSKISFAELLFEKEFVLSSIGASKDCIWVMPAFTDQDVHQARLTLHKQKDIHRQDQDDITAFPTPLRFSICP